MAHTPNPSYAIKMLTAPEITDAPKVDTNNPLNSIFLDTHAVCTEITAPGNSTRARTLMIFDNSSMA